MAHRVGGGGFSQVYAVRPAIEPAAQPTQALKVTIFPADPSTPSAARTHVENEEHALDRLRGVDEIVRCTEWGSAPDHAFVLMELCDGTLAEQVAGGGLAVGAVLRYGLDLAVALRAVHQAGLVHGDVTPGNGFVRADGQVVLGDFGSSADAAALRIAAAAHPEHAAPELGTTGMIDRRTDVYGLGSTLATLVTGTPERRMRPDLARALAGSGSAPEIARLVDLVTACLHPDPVVRPLLDDVVDELRAIDRDLTTPPAHPRRRSRLRARWLVAAAALVAVGAAVAAFLLPGSGPDPNLRFLSWHCLDDATPVDLVLHHSMQLLAGAGPDLTLVDQKPTVAPAATTFVARRAATAPGAPCGSRLVATDGAPGPRCLQAGAPVIAAPCTDSDEQVWSFENHWTDPDGAMWQRLRRATDLNSCLQMLSDPPTGRMIAQVGECGSDWHQQWGVHDLTDGQVTGAGAPPAGPSCSAPARLPLVDASGSTAGAPDLTVRACASDTAEPRGVLVAESNPPVAGATVAWRIELRDCGTGWGLTARDYRPVQQFGAGASFATSTIEGGARTRTGAVVPRGRVGWVVVTDNAGRRWHAGTTAEPIGTTCPNAARPPDLSGTVTDLRPDEGYDLDTGARGAPESAPGLDVSGRSAEYVLDSVATSSGGMLKLLPSGQTAQDCAAAPGGWTKNVPGVPLGGAICVLTSEGNTAVLTVTRAWTGPGDAERLLGFTYQLWRR